MSTSTPQVTETAVNQATDRLIQEACRKHNITPDQLPPSSVEDAKRTAREMVESDQRNEQNEFYHLYNAKNAEVEALKAQLGAVSKNRASQTDNRVVDRMETVRDRMGMVAWQQLTVDARLRAQGIDPQSVDPQQLRKLFGKNTDTTFAVDFQKTNPFKYKQLREAAKTLNITGK